MLTCCTSQQTKHVQWGPKLTYQATTYLNLTLACVRWMIFKDLDGDNFICPLLPALDHLQTNQYE